MCDATGVMILLAATLLCAEQTRHRATRMYSKWALVAISPCGVWLLAKAAGWKRLLTDVEVGTAKP
jgi:hypothetical protein